MPALGRNNGGPRPPGMPQTPLKSERPRVPRVQEEVKVSEKWEQPRVPMSEVQSKNYDHPKLNNGDHYLNPSQRKGLGQKRLSYNEIRQEV